MFWDLPPLRYLKEKVCQLVLLNTWTCVKHFVTIWRDWPYFVVFCWYIHKKNPLETSTAASHHDTQVVRLKVRLNDLSIFLYFFLRLQEWFILGRCGTHRLVADQIMWLNVHLCEPYGGSVMAWFLSLNMPYDMIHAWRQKMWPKQRNRLRPLSLSCTGQYWIQNSLKVIIGVDVQTGSLNKHCEQTGMSWKG